MTGLELKMDDGRVVFFLDVVGAVAIFEKFLKTLDGRFFFSPDAHSCRCVSALICQCDKGKMY